MRTEIDICAGWDGFHAAIVPAVDTFAIDAAARFNLTACKHWTCPVRGKLICFTGAARDLRDFREWCE